MSGIYIPGMEMPNHCGRCPFWDEVMYRRSGTCLATDKIIMCQYDNRPEDCPVITIPDHGRLIDADALLETEAQHWITEYNSDGYAADEIGAYTMTQIDAMPTIIPADRSTE